VSVDIETARRTAALVVAAEDVHAIGSAQPWLQVARDGNARRQPVTVGLRSAGKAEILTGLREGDTVIPLAGGAIADGHRVRVRRPVVVAP
jgi:HlyD family secretion protein